MAQWSTTTIRPGLRCDHWEARMISGIRGEVLATASVVAASVLVIAIGFFIAWTVTRFIRRASTIADRFPAEEQGHHEFRQIAEEQAALRRVATLVARGIHPPVIFDSVLAEIGRLLRVEYATMNRYEADDTLVIVAAWSVYGDRETMPPVGSRWSLDGDYASAIVWRTGRPARTDYVGARGELAKWAREQGIKCGVAGPITVEGRLWGSTTVMSRSPTPQPEDTEDRMLNFIELVNTAIANTQNREELKASRARIAAAADETCRRIGRDLHDGIQQRLIALSLDLRLAEPNVPTGQDDLKKLLSTTAQRLAKATEEIQKIARGLHPVILSTNGLEPALKSLIRSYPVPIELTVDLRSRLNDRIETSVYYVVSEALSNVVKHAHASTTSVDLDTDDDCVRCSIRDDGVGGADPSRGSGLVGIRDRLDALNGTLEIRSRAGQGTALLVTIPLADPAS